MRALLALTPTCTMGYELVALQLCIALLCTWQCLIACMLLQSSHKPCRDTQL
jgi:hypothetical protein